MYISKCSKINLALDNEEKYNALKHRKFQNFKINNKLKRKTSQMGGG